MEFDKVKEINRCNSNVRNSEILSSRDSAIKKNTLDEEGEDVQIKEVIQANPYNSEASLRHLFYMEYKKKFPEG